MKMSLCQMIAIVCILTVGFVTVAPFLQQGAHGGPDDFGYIQVNHVNPQGQVVHVTFAHWHPHNSAHTQTYHSGSYGSSLLHQAHGGRGVIEGSYDVPA